MFTIVEYSRFFRLFRSITVCQKVNMQYISNFTLNKLIILAWKNDMLMNNKRNTVQMDEII